MSQKYGLMLNIDINSTVTPFLNRVAARENFTRADLYPLVDDYATTNITDLFFNVFCQYSAVDSQWWTSYGDKYEQKVENGVEVDYTKEYSAIYKINRTYGMDPYAVWVERAREKGMRSWFSVRMNDCHCPDETVAFLRSDFFYEAREKGWMVGDKYGYSRFCFDYAVPEVREKMLGYIRELLERYDLDGIELDFQREIICFDYQNQPDCHLIMTEFMRQVKQIVTEAAEKWGHTIDIGTRLSRDLEQSKCYGFDAVTWAKEGLVDLVVPTPRWATNDDDMPIAAWKKALPGVAVQAGLDVLVNRQTFVAAMKADVARSLAAKYLAQGSDGLYLFNLFLGHGQSEAIDQQFYQIYDTCISIEKALQHPMRYILMWQDTVPVGYTPYKPLPVTLPAHGEAKNLTFNLGVLPEKSTCTLTLGLEGQMAEDVTVLVNGEKVCLTNAGTADEGGFCQPGVNLVQCTVANAADARYEVALQSVCDRDVTVVYGEIYVNPLA